MGQKNVPDTLHFLQGQVTDTATGVDQDILVNQRRGGSQTNADAPATSKYSYFHLLNTEMVA
jgi:hypothetical protein